MKLKPVGKQGLMSRNQANTVLAVCNGVLNSKLIDTATDEFHITPNNAVYGIGRSAASASSTSLGMHPFKIYPTGTINGSGFIGYNVRTGSVDVRPVYSHPTGSVELVNWNYSYRIIPEGCDIEIGPSDFLLNPVPSANTFFLDPTPEISLGLNVGAYYSFWVTIVPDTDNSGGVYNGVVALDYKRFSIGSTPTDPFPGLPSIDGSENIPIGIVQVTPANPDPLIHIDGQNDTGLIWQWLHDNYTDYFPGQSGIRGSYFQGRWEDPGVSSPYRLWYPGDWTIFYSGTPGDPINGRYDAISSPTFPGGSPTSPADAGLIQTSRGDL